MSERVERQRWLAGLALAVAVPLPFTGIVSWPFVIAFLLVGALVMAARKPLPPLPAWVENVLAVVILAMVVMAGGVRFGVLRPIAQLAVLVAAVLLIGCHEPRRSWRALAVLIVVGVAGVASSTHPTLILYLLGLVTLTVVAVGRLQTSALAERRQEPRVDQGWPPLRLVVVTVVIATVVAAPLFALFPRLRSPFAATPFGGRSVSGFREGVILRGLGAIKESRAPALTVRFPGAKLVPPEWLRLVGVTLQYYRGGLWARGRLRAEHLAVTSGGLARLADRPSGDTLQRAEIELLRSREVLMVPVGSVALKPPAGVPVSRDPLGVLRVPRGSGEPLRYAVEFAPDQVIQPAPEDEDLKLPADPDAIAELAREIASETRGARAQAVLVETYLRSHFRYTVSLPPDAPLREDPVKWFLFRGRAGHCEFFASAMVLLLRSLDIPARLQAGYAGGEPLADGSFLVRESDAHAWVVAWVGDHWQVFDPTPAEGRPGVAEQAAGLPWAMGWDRLEGLWDRWVLTFSLSDQVDLLSGVAAFLRTQRRNLGRGVLASVAVALVGVLLVRWVRRLRGRSGELRRDRISRALRRVMAAARQRGVAGPALTPRQFGRVVAVAVPEAAAPLRWLVDRHERAHYAGGSLPDRAEVARAVAQVMRALRQRG